jgi:NAD(P)-dependent dehydrogenase (short-subunit alcohol dehydrogenase family)
MAVLGGLDILVTNAGGPPTGSFDKANDADWELAYQLNLMSAVRLIRMALPALKASRRGRIVNLTGYGVKEPMTDLVVSDAVRAGVTVMAKTIASDLAPFGITVNNIAPGPIMTDRLIEIHATRAKSLGITLEEQLSRFSQTIPVRRNGRAERNRRSLRLPVLAAGRIPHRAIDRRGRGRQPFDLIHRAGGGARRRAVGAGDIQPEEHCFDAVARQRRQIGDVLCDQHPAAEQGIMHGKSKVGRAPNSGEVGR